MIIIELRNSTALGNRLDLSRGSLTQFHGVLDRELNLHWNIPLIGQFPLVSEGPQTDT